MYNIKTVLTECPSYLKELLRTNDFVYITYDEKGSDDRKMVSNNFEQSTLDLTGSPLESSINREDSMNLETLNRDNMRTWTSEEDNHFPVDIKTARNIINKFSRDKSLKKSSSFYCVCDGNDKNHTIILGINLDGDNFIRTLINNYGYIPINDEILNIDSLSNKHIKNLRSHPENTLYHKEIDTYVLYGENIANYHYFDICEYNGNVLMEVTWKKCLQNIKFDIPDVLLKFQVFVGHENSSIYTTQWKELNLLNKLILLYNDHINVSNCYIDSFNDTEFSSDYEDICLKISNMLDEETTLRIKLQRKTGLDSLYIRSETFIDRLWYMLKSCEDLNCLKNSFHFLFQQMVQRDLQTNVFEEVTSVIGCILKGMFNKQMAVPTLNLLESLQLLIELGLQKVKLDYVHVIKAFDRNIKYNLSNWENSSQVDFLSTYSGSMKKLWLPVEETASFFNRQLTYLSRLHVVTEFLLLTKNCENLSQNVLDSLANRACEKFLLAGSPVDGFECLNSHKLYELCVVGEYNEEILNSLHNPISTSIEMVSKKGSCTTRTVFYKSRYPVFPFSIYNKYDNLEAEGVYMSEIVQF